MNITDKETAALWPTWPHGARLRFVTDVLEHKDVTHEETYTRGEFLLMAVERWLASVCPMFDESKRFFLCKALKNDDEQFNNHAEQLVDPEGIQGFHLSIFDDRWASWDRSKYAVDVMTFGRIEALPRPHIWVTILGVTPLYFRLMVDLEELANVDTDGKTGHPGDHSE